MSISKLALATKLRRGIWGPQVPRRARNGYEVHLWFYETMWWRMRDQNWAVSSGLPRMFKMQSGPGLVIIQVDCLPHVPLPLSREEDLR
jgi:hypothetical protein